jgi:hypothetical protein
MRSSYCLGTFHKLYDDIQCFAAELPTFPSVSVSNSIPSPKNYHGPEGSQGGTGRSPLPDVEFYQKFRAQRDKIAEPTAFTKACEREGPSERVSQTGLPIGCTETYVMTESYNICSSNR